MTSNHKTKTTKITITTLITVAVTLFVGSAYLLAEHAKLNNTTLSLQEELNKQKDITANLATLQSLDNSVFSGQGETTLERYRELLEDSSFMLEKSQLENRIAYLTNTSKSQTTFQENVKEVRTSQFMPNEVALQNNVNPILIDTGISDSLENKITELNRKVSSRERALEEKENLKAITIQSTEGVTIQYVGDTKNGKANGEGTGLWQSSGGTYKGSWLDNKRHGYGTYTWKDGVRYEGNYVNDHREGKGAYYWPSGERYEGQWKSNRRNGNGTLYDKDGNITYEGNWINDKPKKK